MASAAEMRARASKAPAPLPKAVHTVTQVEGQHLILEAQKLGEELALRLQAEPGSVGENGERTKEPRKAGQRPSPRIDEIKAAQTAILGRLAEFQNELELTGMTPGEWHRFKEEHPADPNSDLDQELADGALDASALFHAMGRFASAWNGDPISEDDWANWTADGILYADRCDLVTVVVRMHENRMVRVPKSLSGSSETATSATG